MYASANQSRMKVKVCAESSVMHAAAAAVMTVCVCELVAVESAQSLAKSLVRLAILPFLSPLPLALHAFPTFTHTHTYTVHVVQ